MKRFNTNRLARRCLLAVVLAGAGLSPSLFAAATAPTLDPQIALRPVTPGEPKQWGLTNVQAASGLSTVGIGQPAYLEVLANKNFASADIVSVTWELTAKPVSSQAALATSPLGSNVPTYKMADRLATQVAGRTLLRPDVAGDYTVVATITTKGGTTNLTQKVTAGTYMGATTCALCHSGGQIAENTYVKWSETPHAHMLENGLNGNNGDHYGKNCISCHTVGYDVTPSAVNGGFDDVAKALNWTFPTVLTNGTYAAMPADLKKVSNIQCENCHGPGSQHAFSLGDTTKISKTLAASDCAQCHDSPPHHSKNAEWNNSTHAISVVETEADCTRCHTAKGFANYTGGKPAEETEAEVITCSACHDPHDATNPHQTRTASAVTLMDKKTTITKGGAGLLCMNCHMSRRDAATYAETTPGSTRFGPHHGPQSDMLAGANAVTYGKQIPSSAHKDVVGDACVTCHMQEVAETSPAFTHAGGHTFSMAYTATNGATVDVTDACAQCHGDITSFDFARQDYDGDGVVDGVQTEVKHLLDKLALMLPPVGTPKTSLSINNTWTRKQLKAAYNYQFVLEDGSFGVHNLAYAVGLLKASIADITGDSNNDGLPDDWQIQYFGDINAPNAAPGASPAGDGIPNWLKYSLGIDPTVPGATMPGGVVWANGKSVVNPGGTNSIAIYTAAEVVFNTETGKTYQIQSASTANTGWQNVGTPITGTGSAVSYVTPTRSNLQQFYRVVTQ